MSAISLDKLAAQHAQQIVSSGQSADEVDNLATKALGVLQEDGIYACGLFLLSRPEREHQLADHFVTNIMGILRDLPLPWGTTVPTDPRTPEVLAFLATEVAGDRLDRLLLVRETLERMLIYCRYGAKARRAGEGASTQAETSSGAGGVNPTAEGAGRPRARNGGQRK